MVLSIAESPPELPEHPVVSPKSVISRKNPRKTRHFLAHGPAGRPAPPQTWATGSAAASVPPPDLTATRALRSGNRITFRFAERSGIIDYNVIWQPSLLVMDVEP